MPCAKDVDTCIRGEGGGVRRAELYSRMRVDPHPGIRHMLT